MAISHTYQHQSGSFQAEALKECTLSFCLQPGILTYSVLSKEGKIIAVKEYRSGNRNETETIEAALESDPIFASGFAHRVAYSPDLKFALIPNDEFKTGSQHEIARVLIAPDSADHYVETTAIPSLGAVAVFTVPVPFSEACSRLGDVKHRPLCSASIPMATMLSGKSPRHLLISVSGEVGVITAVKDRKIQYCNLVDASSAENLLYFAEIATRVSGLENSELQVYFTGFSDADEKISSRLKELVPGMIFPIQEFMGSFETQSEKLPVWKYAFLSF